MRVLVVEDDKKTASFVVKGLRQAGFAVDHADNGSEGLKRAHHHSYDAAVIDVMLPELDGLSLIDRLRTEEITTPVLILSAKRSVRDRVRGLQTGGDDYLTKPFSFSELLARVQALIRRASLEPELTRLESGDLTLDLSKREVTRAGRQLDLQPREFALLEYLMRNTGRVVSKTMVVEHVCGYDLGSLTSVVDVWVSRLRKKIDRDFEKKLIQTYRGVGYALKVS